MASVNKVILIGNLGQNPEGKDLNGVQLATFSVATTYRGKNGDVTEWTSVKCFGRTAEIAVQYLRKGSPVYVEGRLSTSKWEKDGAKFQRTEVVCERLQFLGSKPSGDAPAETAPAQNAAPAQTGTGGINPRPTHPNEPVFFVGDNADDIPF